MKKQTIMYNNKKMKLPYTLTAGETSTEMVTRQNPFSGQSIELPEFAAVVYDTIIGAEQFEDWDTVRAGLDWFKQYFAEQYMAVLD